jgi:diguanylate cyclase (GGDEF)-like protein
MPVARPARPEEPVVTEPHAPQPPSFEEAARRVLAYLREAVPLALWSVTRVENGRQTYLYLEHNGYDLLPRDGGAWEDGFCVHMAAGTGPAVAPDVRAVPVYAAAPWTRELSIGSYAGAAVLEPDGSLFGTICGFDPQVRAGDPAFLALQPLLQLLSHLLSMVLAASRAHDVAARGAADARAAAELDAPTGVVSRRGWDRIVADEAARFAELADPTAVMVVALDDRARINDEQGHGAADACLRTAGETLRAAVGPGDVVARLGDDEFGVLLRGCTRDQGKQRVSRLYAQFEAAGVAGSIGCASVHPMRGVLAAAAEAAAAMAAAKRVRAAARTARSSAVPTPREERPPAPPAPLPVPSPRIGGALRAPAPAA